MSAKDKAEELVLKYLRIDNNTKGWFNTYIAKQCAIIVVEEIIEECYKWSGGDNSTWDRERFNFWTEVKREIENL
jgi:hypothetical protein